MIKSFGKDNTLLFFELDYMPKQLWVSHHAIPIFFGSATCQTKVHISLAPSQTQFIWTQLHARLKHLWLWYLTRPNLMGLNYMLDLSFCGSSTLLDPTPLSLVTSQNKPLVSSLSYKTQLPFRPRFFLQIQAPKVKIQGHHLRTPYLTKMSFKDHPYVKSILVFISTLILCTY